MSKNYFHAIAIMFGTIVGVGIFTVPYVVNQAGILLFVIYLPLLAYIQHLLHLYFAEIVLSTNNHHRIPGYMGKYYGKKAKFFAATIALLGLNGTLLAYIIAGGVFFREFIIYLGGNSFDIGLPIFTLLLFIIESIIVLIGLKLIARVESFLNVLLLGTLVVIILRSIGHINIENFPFLNLNNFFILYGPVFFSVGGTVGVPAVCRLLEKEKEKIKSALFWGTIISVFFILIFTLAVVGVTGDSTTPDAIIGLNHIIGNGITSIILLFALITIITSFIIVADTLKELYSWDYKISKNISWFLACAIPYFMYLFGLHNLTKTVSLTGAITGGLIGVILILLVFAVKKRGERESIIKNKISSQFAIIISLFFILGLIYEVWQIFR